MTRSTRLVCTIFATLVALLVTSSLAHATTIVRRSSRFTPFRVGTMTGLYVGFSIKNDSLNGFGPWSEEVDIWVALENFTQLSGDRMPELAANEDGYYHIGPVAAGETFYVFFYLDWPYATDPVDPTDPSRPE